MNASTDNVQRLPWYDYSKLWSHNGFYNCVLGARGTGKTFGAKIKGIKDAINKGREFIYLRRFEEEIKVARKGFFADVIAENSFPDYDFKVEGREGFYAHISTRDDKKRPWKICVYFAALSGSAKVKSQSFPNVTLIIFDEFVIEKGHTQYLPNEAKTFNDFYSTVDRYKGKTRALLLSNSVSIMNPYFLAWNIVPEESDEWMILAKGFIVVHFHNSDHFASKVFETAFGQFIQDTEYADYAVGNKFKDNNKLMIGTKPPEAKYWFTLETLTGGAMSIWRDMKSHTWYAQRKRPKVEDVCTLDPGQASPEKTLLITSDMRLSYIKTAYRHGKLFFDNPQTRNAFREIM